MICLLELVEKERDSVVCVGPWRCDEPNIRQRFAREQTEMLAAAGNIRVPTVGKMRAILVSGLDMAIVSILEQRSNDTF